MSHSDPQQPCPKCGLLFSQSQMFSHWNSCKGQPVSTPSPYPQQQLNPMQWPQPQPQMIPMYQAQPVPQQFIPTPTNQPLYQAPPVHKHSWIENDSYKWCIECRALSLKLRGMWFLFVRYGLKLFWVTFLLNLVLALGLVSYFHIGR